MKHVSLERFLERLNCEVYPITILKFLLNRRRILTYFSKAADSNFEIKEWRKFNLDTDECSLCKTKVADGILCRQHTSLKRVQDAKNVMFDLDTNLYFYKNEIFRMVGNKLVIVYCPHSKLISGDIEDSKVRKVNVITVEDPKLISLPEYEGKYDFISSDLMEQRVSCWFNKEYTIVTDPEDRNFANWCLITNK